MAASEEYRRMSAAMRELSKLGQVLYPDLTSMDAAIAELVAAWDALDARYRQALVDAAELEASTSRLETLGARWRSEPLPDEARRAHLGIGGPDA